MTKIVLSSLCFALAFLTCISGVVETHKEIKRYFAMPAYVGAVPDHVRSAVLEHVQPGCTQEEVLQFLQSRGIGIDGSSTCELNDSQDRLTCKFGMHGHPWALIRERYLIVFGFDSNRKLNSVKVSSGLAAPSWWPAILVTELRP